MEYLSYKFEKFTDSLIKVIKVWYIILFKINLSN